MYNIKLQEVIFIIIIVAKYSKQDCAKEITQNGISVTWPYTPSGFNIKSDPYCYGEDGKLITRDCNDTMWSPFLSELAPCMKVVKNFDLNSCPPGYFKISDNNTEYCYQISPPSAWNYPCFKSGGASVITDLNKNEVKSLLNALNNNNTSRYYWLPAQRQKAFNPIVWTIPGPNWGIVVESNNDIAIAQSILRNCLLLDVERKIIITEACDRIFPSLCFYINNLHYPATCPDGYHSFRFMPDKGTCFGIEYSGSIFGSTFNDFLNNKCKRPMGDSDQYPLTRFIFKKIADITNLPDNEWCWFESSYVHNGSHINPREGNSDNSDSGIITEVMVASLEGIINNEGTLGLMNTMSTLTCMACEADIVYNDTELMFEYNNEEELMYLTVYFPSGLWKYESSDKGVQCFSNAKGFVNVVDIEDIPVFKICESENYENNYTNVDKIIYAINPVSDRSGQYWCEAHTQNFTFLSTRKIVVNPQGNKEHVFSLVIKTDNFDYIEEDFPDFTEMVSNISEIFNAKKTVIMNILDFTQFYITILLHLHVDLLDTNEDDAINVLQTYEELYSLATTELPKYSILFVNMSSSTHCLPTTSQDIFDLNWEMTVIGQITAPKQFCLQSNGLPVKRQCGGSYSLGSIWGPVDSNCSKNYEASDTTTFLYNVAKGNNYTAHFLTTGLSYVLNDTDIIIPADIYYLSMSFQHVLSKAQENTSSVEIGDIENIAWAMNRVMTLDDQYLRLAQTLNSTNVILDSVNDIIEIIASQNESCKRKLKRKNYEIAVESKFVTQISFPYFTNVSGIALLRNSLSDNFTDMTIMPLYINTTLDYVLKLKNMEIATWIPEMVIKSLQINKNNSLINDVNSSDVNFENVHVVINLFYNDAVFQELDFRKHMINSRIVGISIPGFISNLIHPIPLLFRQLNNTEAQKTCSYWDFHADSLENTPGHWANDGCYFVRSLKNMTICKCYHLTHFGQLISVGWKKETENNEIDIKHSRALNVITLVGCFLSLIGIVGIWITAVVFHSWRKKAGTKVLLQLTAAISLPLILILVFNLDDTIFVQHDGTYVVAENMVGVCITLGALLHYSILSGFVWMLITAILQFIRYVRVLGVRRPSRFMIKFTLIGWGIPVLPVMAILIINKENYLPIPSTPDAYNGPICYPTGYYFIYAVVLPIIVVLIINVVLFASVMYSISRGPDGKMRDVDLDLIGAQLRLSIFLFFLLGLSWFFGILTFCNNIIWSYLFCLTSTLQGFVLFLYFVICDPATRSLWLSLMKPQFRSSSSRESIVSFHN